MALPEHPLPWQHFLQLLPQKWRERFEKISKFVSVIFVFMAIIALLSNIITFPVSLNSFTRWISGRTYRLSASTHDLPIGSEANISLIGFYNADNSAAETNGFVCEWNIHDLDVIERKDDCKIIIRASKRLSQGIPQKNISIDVSVRSASGKIIKVESNYITIHNFTRPIINANTIISSKYNQNISFSLDQAGRDILESCAWKPPEIFTDPESCDTTTAGAQIPATWHGQIETLALRLYFHSGENKGFYVDSADMPLRVEDDSPSAEKRQDSGARKDPEPPKLMPPDTGPTETFIGRKPTTVVANKRWVILADVVARKTPNKYGDPTGNLLSGETVKIVIPEHDGWAQVQSGDGIVGFVEKKNLGD